MALVPPWRATGTNPLRHYRQALEASFRRLDALLDELMGRGNRPN